MAGRHSRRRQPGSPHRRSVRSPARTQERKRRRDRSSGGGKDEQTRVECRTGTSFSFRNNEPPRKIARKVKQATFAPEAWEALRGARCHKCHGGHSSFDNDLGICDGCHRAYHAQCHHPEVAWFGDVDDNWYCSECTAKMAQERGLLQVHDFCWVQRSGDRVPWPARVVKIDFTSIKDAKPYWVEFFNVGPLQGDWVETPHVLAWSSGKAPNSNRIRQVRQRAAVRLAEAAGAPKISQAWEHRVEAPRGEVIESAAETLEKMKGLLATVQEAKEAAETKLQKMQEAKEAAETKLQQMQEANAAAEAKMQQMQEAKAAAEAKMQQMQEAKAAAEAKMQQMQEECILPHSRALTLSEVCHAAGKGLSTGQTVQDDEVEVLNPEGKAIAAEKFETFDDSTEIPLQLREDLRKSFTSPSQIQACTWPLTLKGHDVIGLSATGSGKTLAFLVPAFARMVTKQAQDGPGALVVSPTRELALQTQQEAVRFGICVGMRSLAMTGGAPKGEQIKRYQQGCHVIVACPGRLIDFLESKQVQLTGIHTLVLDEADRLLNLGFEDQIRHIILKLPSAASTSTRHQTMFFTATWPEEVRKLAQDILHRPYTVTSGKRQTCTSHMHIKQSIKVLEPSKKKEALFATLHEAGLTNPSSCAKALVFCGKKITCDEVVQYLWNNNVLCTCIHGGMKQQYRSEALDSFIVGRSKVLVATDVMGRGVDIKGIGLVLNYDSPSTTEDYVHRIGRTGRAGAKGWAITFLTAQDGTISAKIKEVMERTNQEITPELQRLAAGSKAT